MTPKACCLFFVAFLVGCFPFSKPSEEALPSRPTTLDKMVQKMARKIPKKQIPKSVLVDPIHYKRTKMVLTQFASTQIICWK